MFKCLKQMTVALVSAYLTFASVSYADGGAGTVIAGPADAPLTIEEYVDFSCHFCADGSMKIKEAMNDYPGKIKLVLRNMPLPMHPNALVAAKAFDAVWLQCSVLANLFQANLFAHQQEFNIIGEPYLYELAAKVGADVDEMKRDMASDKVATMIAQDQAAADANGFKGTPSFVIGSETVTGDRHLEEFKKVIDRELGH